MTRNSICIEEVIANSKMNVKVKLTAFFALGAALVLLIGLSIPASLAAVFGVYLATGGYDLVWILIVTFPRDVRYVYKILPFCIYLLVYQSYIKYNLI